MKSKKLTQKKCNYNFNKITPQTLLKLFGNNNIAIVNTLDNNIVLNKEDVDVHCCYGKNFIDNNCNYLQKFNIIVLYCANYTCSASINYANNLVKKCNNLLPKIVIYEGGIFEWATLSFSFPEKFIFYDLKKKQKLTDDSIKEQFLNMKHYNESDKKNETFQDIILNNQQNNTFYNNILENDFKTSVYNNDSNKLKILNDKICVVTGGTSGLGLEVVKKMLENDAKHVTLTYYHDKERANKVEKMLINKYGKNRVYVLKADARTISGNKKTFDRTLRNTYLKNDYGAIDCVDINAGIFGPSNIYKKHIFNIDEKDYNKTLDTNLNGYFLALKYFSKQAIENNVKDASVVCIKSIYGSGGSLFSNTAYQISKHGVMGLVRQSAVELSRPNNNFKIKYPIRVNAVSPTFTDTALTRPFLEKNKINNVLKNSNTMNHLAYKENVAEAVLFLLSNKSRCITGIDLPVDCGVLSEVIPYYESVNKLNNSGIEELSCCGNTL